MFISIKAARQGKSITSLSNVLGSNTFDLLIAVPMAVLIAGAVTINLTRAVPMMGFLMFATIAMFVLMRREMELSRKDSIVMLVLYTLFVVWMALESFGVLSAVGV
jgi:cation:H+ antiporter